MAALGSQTIASSYEQLLHVDTDGGGNTTTLVPIKDGDNGTTFCLQIATTSALINGSGSKLYFSDAGGEYLSGDGTTLTITAGGVNVIKLDANSRTSLSNNDSGTSNTIFGKSAGASLDAGSNYNTFIGEAVSDAAMNDAINNTGVGYNSLGALTTGDYNTAIGDHALLANQTGEVNVAVGTSALRANTASQNTALGGNAMYANVGGENNVAVGHNALDANVSGNLNVAVGKDALGAFIGSASVAVGREALRDLNHASAADGTVAVGTGAGASLTSGAGNVAIGYQALDADDGGNYSTAVGYQALTDQAGTSGDDAGNTAVGFKAGFDVSTGYYNTLIGRTAGFAITTGAGNTVIGGEAGKAIVGGDDNTIIGKQAGLNASSTTKTTFIGAESGGLGVTSGGENTAVGYRAGYDMTSCTHNCVVGNESGSNLTSGQSNTALGSQSLISDKLGSGSTAVGYAALNRQVNATSGDSYLTHNTGVGGYAGYFNITGINNTYIGYEAGFGHVNQNNSGNTAVGADALYDIKTGTNNVSVGKASGYSQEEGDFNVYIGYEAGYYNDNADTEGHNVLIGYDNGKSITTGTNNVGLGSRAMGESGSNAITGANNVCLGSLAGYNMSGTTANNSILGQGAGYDLTTGQNNLFLGHDAGVLGSPGGRFTTQSSIIVLGDENNGASHIQTDWTVASDKRDKTDVKDLDLGLEFINKLTPVTYKWDKRSKYIDKHDPTVDLNEVVTDGTHKEDWLDVGFLAQDVAEIESSYNYKIAEKTNLTTSLSEDGKQYGTIYAKFVPILVKAVQELSAKVKALENA